MLTSACCSAFIVETTLSGHDITAILSDVTSVTITLDRAYCEGPVDAIASSDSRRSVLYSAVPADKVRQVVARRYAELVTAACPNASVVVTHGSDFHLTVICNSDHTPLDGGILWQIIQSVKHDAWDWLTLDTYYEVLGVSDLEERFVRMAV